MMHYNELLLKQKPIQLRRSGLLVKKPKCVSYILGDIATETSDRKRYTERDR